MMGCPGNEKSSPKESTGEVIDVTRYFGSRLIAFSDEISNNTGASKIFTTTPFSKICGGAVASGYKGNKSSLNCGDGGIV